MNRLNPKQIFIITGILMCLSVNATSKPLNSKTKISTNQARANGHRFTDAEVSSERTIATDTKPTIFLCAAAGDLTINGWERNELRVRSKDEAAIDFHTNSAANRIDVVVSSGDSRREGRIFSGGECSSSTDLELNVPRGANIQIKTRAGNIDVRDVSEARVETASGDISIERVARGCEASTLSGDVRVRDVRGRARLKSVSGGIEAVNVQAIDAGDTLTASTISGDVRLERVTSAHVEATTTSGEVRLKGPLMRGGRYDLKSTSGDVTVLLPSDASCQVNARVFQSGDIISDFPLKFSGSSGARNLTRQLVGIIGADSANAATLNLSSFSGTVHLRRNQ